MKTCPRCRYRSSAQALVCGRCGAPLPESGPRLGQLNDIAALSVPPSPAPLRPVSTTPWWFDQIAPRAQPRSGDRRCRRCGQSSSNRIECIVCGNPFAGEPRWPALLNVNLEVDHPPLEEAQRRLEDVLGRARFHGVKVLRLIHGHGSSGRGGIIRLEIRRQLQRHLDASHIAAWHSGESLSPGTLLWNDLVKRFAELGVSDAENPGITLVEIG